MKAPKSVETSGEDHRAEKWRVEGDATLLSIDTVSRALSAWLGGNRVLGATLLAGGLMNRNLLVRLGGPPFHCVLRLYDRDPAACAKEQAVLDLVRRDVPVPEVFFASHHSSDELPPFLILEYVDGLSLRALREMNETHAVGAAAYEAGQCLARFSRHVFSSSGSLDAKLDVATTGWLGDTPVTNATLADHFMRAPLFAERVERPVREKVLRFAHESDARFAELPNEPVLVHGDYNGRNIFARRDGDQWRLSAILDWEFAFAGPVYCDIGNFVRYDRPDRSRYEPAFSQGCRAGGIELPPDWLRIARAADLPALLELLGRPSTPDHIVRELLDLVADTVG